MSDYEDVTFYAQIEPEWDRYIGGELILARAKATRITQRQPDPPRNGALVVKVILRIPTGRLLPLAPAVVVLGDDPAAVVMDAEVIS